MDTQHTQRMSAKPVAARLCHWAIVYGAALALAGAAPADAAPLPDPIRAMIETAFAGNDPGTIAAVIDVAKKTAPASVAEIKELEAGYENHVAASEPKRVQVARARIGAASSVSLWKGEIEVGGSQSTGSGQDLELHLGAKATRTGLDWTQKMNLQADYGQSFHETTTEKILASYQPQRKWTDRAYAFGLAEYERDRFLGYQDRYVLGVGVGGTALDYSKLKIELNAGPALRYALYTQQSEEAELAARGSVSATWTVRPGLTVAEEAAVYVDRSRSTARSTVSLETDVLGPIKARLSYNVQFEHGGPLNQRLLDTLSRATLVYGF